MSGNGIQSSGESLGRLGAAAGAILLVVVVGVAVSWAGCGNHHTPPGHAGYVKSKPLVGAGEFVGAQIGPTSTGWVWRQEVVNIDIRPRTFSEEMTIPTSDRLHVKLTAHARVRPVPASKDEGERREDIRELVEQFGGETWYASNVRDRFRSAVRDKVQQLAPFEVKGKMRAIGDEVLADMRKAYADKPIEFLAVDIGDIQYPEGVVQSVIRKMVTNEDNERAEIQADIAREQIKIGSAEAEGIAQAQEVIRSTLDPMFLQFEALRAIEKLAESKNTSFIIMPFSKDGGGSPVIMNLEK